MTRDARETPDASGEENRLRFAHNFRAARIKAGLTQGDVGKALGYRDIGQGYVSKIERGEQNVTLDRISHLAKIVGTTLNDLLLDFRVPSEPAHNQEPKPAAERQSDGKTSKPGP